MKYFYLLIILIFINQNISAKDLLNASLSKINKESNGYKILNMISKKLDYNLNLNQNTFNTRLFQLKTGKIDIASGLLKRKERESYIYFIKKPYKYASKRVFLILNDKEIYKYEDLHKFNIGVTKYARYFKKFDNDNKINKIYVSYYKNNIMNLLNNNIDALILDENTAFNIINELNLYNKIKVAKYVVQPDEYVYIGISKKSKLMDDIQKVEKEIIELIDNNISKLFIN